MGFFRGEGGTGDATTDAVASQVAIDAQTATTKANEAASSATTASTKASEAATSATNAASSATTASTQATSATNSASAASSSATAAAISRTNASSSETAAGVSASSATAAKVAAETAKTAAETAETNAASSATTATTKASEASTSASNAASSATAAASSATAAANSATAAASSATAAENAKEAIDGLYLGVATSNPTVDGNGNAVTAGDWYFNTSDSTTRIYDGSAWNTVNPDLVGDSSPQLGGNLDLNSRDITGTGNVNITGNISLSGTVDGRDVATDGTKLDGIEASATADQTASEIRTLVESASDSNVFTDADHTKLNGIEASADVTDTANVTAAGALMDSEVTNLAQVKAFDSSDYATAAQGSTADSALQNVVEDTTPQLGGDLASNGNDVVFADNDKAIFGAGSDLQIFHDGSNNFISSETGALIIRAQADDNDVIINSDNGSGGTSNYFRADGSTGAAKLYNYGNQKLATTSTGIDVTGTVTADGGLIGDAVSGSLSQTGMLTVSDTNTTNTWTNFTGTAAYLPFAHELAVVNLADATTNSFAGLYFMAGETSAASGISSARIGAIRTGASTADLAFSTRGGGDMIQAMRIAGNGDISFYEDTGTTAKFFWDASAEKLGLGTTSPAREVHVTTAGQNGVRLTSTAFGADFGLLSSVGGNNGFGIYDYNATTYRFNIDSSGNVGIGTSSPARELEVTGSGNVYVKVTAPTANDSAGLELANTGATWLIQNDDTSNEALTFDRAGTEVMRIDDSGNVGIGTSSPGQLLDVAGASAPTIRITNTDTTLEADQVIGALEFKGSDSSEDGSDVLAAIKALATDVTPDSELAFFTLRNVGAQDDSITERMRIDQNGNVGIGTTSPAQKVHASSTGITYFRATGGSGNTGIDFGQHSNNNGYVWLRDNTGLLFGQNNTERMRIDPSGNFLVGTTSNVVANSSSNVGTAIGAGLIESARAGVVAQFNRHTSDGAIVDFQKAGTTFGRIGVSSNDNLYISSISADHAGLLFGTHAFYPLEANALSNGTIQLGDGTYRFKDIYSNGLDITSSASNGFNIVATDTAPDTSFNAMKLDYNVSGSGATTGDRSHIGLNIDVDSSATGGNTTDEHRLYGIYNNVKATGDSDLIYGIYSVAEAEQTAGQASVLIGVYGQATTDAVSGTVTNSYGVFGYNSLAASSGTTINNGYALYGKALVGAGQDSNINSVHGLYAEVEVDASGASTTISNIYGVRSEIDNDAGTADTTINNSFLFYGNYAGDLPTSAYGVYIPDSVRNYFGGRITTGDGSASAASYSFNGDTNTGMFSPADHTLGWATNGAEEMRLTAAGDLHVDGNVIAYSTTISDRRLKSDITNISDALNKVGQINGVTFVRDHNGEKAAGVVAQEIMEVLPEAVKSQALPLQTGEQDQEYYVVEYDAVTGLLVEAVKELKARVEALESQ